jgi:hypothetical protein
LERAELRSDGLCICVSLQWFLTSNGHADLRPCSRKSSAPEAYDTTRDRQILTLDAAKSSVASVEAACRQVNTSR